MTNGDESAFPEVLEYPQFNSHTYGLSKREYFAAMAMQGILANADIDPRSNSYGQLAVRRADELIVALNQETK